MPGADAAVSESGGGALGGVLTERRRGESYRQVLQHLLELVRALQSTTGDGEPLSSALDAFMGSLHDLLEAEGALVVGEKGGQLSLNGVRVHADAELFPVQKFLLQALAAGDLNGVLIERGAGRDEVCAFLDRFLSARRQPGLDDEDVEEDAQAHVHPVKRPDLAVDGVVADANDAACRSAPSFSRQTYFKSLFVLRHLLAGVRGSCCCDPREAKQSVQSIVDHVLEDRDGGIAFDLIREWDRPTFRHGINTAVLAMALGRCLGLARGAQRDLGVAALLHEADRAERSAADPAPRRAAFRRLVMKGGTSPMMLVALHVAWDLARAGEPRPSRLARVVDLASRFQIWCAPLDEEGKGLLPRAALQRLRLEGHAEADPELFACLEAIVQQVEE